jgi:hypothetical protein
MHRKSEQHGAPRPSDDFEREGIPHEATPSLGEAELLKLGVVSSTGQHASPQNPSVQEGYQHRSRMNTRGRSRDRAQAEHVPWFPLKSLVPLIWYVPAMYAKDLAFANIGPMFANYEAVATLLLFALGCANLSAISRSLERTDPSGVHRVNLSIVGPGVLALTGAIAALVPSATTSGYAALGAFSAAVLVVCGGVSLILGSVTLSSLRRPGQVGPMLFGLGLAGCLLLIATILFAFMNIDEAVRSLDVPLLVRNSVDRFAMEFISIFLVGTSPLLAFFALGLQATLTPLDRRQEHVKHAVTALLIGQCVGVLYPLGLLTKLFIDAPDHMPASVIVYAQIFLITLLSFGAAWTKVPATIATPQTPPAA